MLQSELLNFTVQILNTNEIPYMLTGSTVSSLQGEPRSTHDIDIVILLESSLATSFADVFPATDFYMSEQSIKDAIKHKNMFNVIDIHSGNKLDFWILSHDEYDITRFKRRQKVSVEGFYDFYVTSPEDTILSKLKWAKMAGGSQKQINDATSVYELQADLLDQKYMDYWIKILALENQWNQLQNNLEN